MKSWQYFFLVIYRGIDEFVYFVIFGFSEWFLQDQCQLRYLNIKDCKMSLQTKNHNTKTKQNISQHKLGVNLAFIN